VQLDFIGQCVDPACIDNGDWRALMSHSAPTIGAEPSVLTAQLALVLALALALVVC
jgi:hypothetical protein